jgi:GGDEF domain-containing protein
MTPNLIVAALGPFAELLGVVVLYALFTLLRSQADRRPYFKAWEESWVMMAVALVAAVIFQRLTDPNSVLYASSPFWPWLFGFVYLAFKLLSLALLVSGARLFLSGSSARLLVKVAAPLGLALSFAADTFNGRLAALGLAHGLFAVAAYAYGASLFATLPASRHSVGSRLASLTLAALATLWAALVVFYFSARLGSTPPVLLPVPLGLALSAQPWFVRFERYGFYADLLLQLSLAYAMVRLLFEDGERESVDTRAQLELLQDRQRLPQFYDEPSGLLNRRAFDASVGLDFAHASFGSVVRLRLTNLEKTITEQGASVGDTLLKHFAGVLDNAVRAHDRVYRWDNRDFLVVMPRAVPRVANARMQLLVTRAAPLLVAGVREAIRPEIVVAVAPFTGSEDLAGAVKAVSEDPRLR